jgi:hypothetical protein
MRIMVRLIFRLAEEQLPYYPGTKVRQADHEYMVPEHDYAPRSGWKA